MTDFKSNLTKLETNTFEIGLREGIEKLCNKASRAKWSTRKPDFSSRSNTEIAKVQRVLNKAAIGFNGKLPVEKHEIRPQVARLEEEDTCLSLAIKLQKEASKAI